MKNKILWLVVLVACLLAFPVLAQTELDETYVAADDTYQISYPAGWAVDDTNPAFTVLSGRMGTGRFALTTFSTETIAIFSIGAVSAVGVTENVAEVFEFISGEVEAFPLDGRDVARADVDLDGQPGIAYVLEMDDGSYGLVVVLASDAALKANADFILSVVESYNVPGDAVDAADENESDTPLTLENYGGDWQTAIAELQELELIGSGGSLVFQENQAFFNGQGFFFTPLGRRSPYTDVVMAGELTFSSSTDEEYEECSLLARVVNAGGQNVTTYLQVGLDNRQDVFFYDTEGTDESVIYDFLPLDLDLEEPHHLLFLLVNDTLTIYVDGELAFDQTQVNAERSGTYGIALMGRERGSRCEGHNIWVYQVPSFEAGVCEVSSNNTVNRRSGPGTNFEQAGTLNRGTVLQAVGQATGSDGFIWWELEDGSWVRDDIVTAAGDCTSVPESEQ